MNAVRTYEEILNYGKSEAVKKVAADSILDRAGYKAHTEKTKVSVEITEKMAKRFEEVLSYKGISNNGKFSENDHETKVSIKTEMSE